MKSVGPRTTAAEAATGLPARCLRCDAPLPLLGDCPQCAPRAGGGSEPAPPPDGEAPPPALVSRPAPPRPRRAPEVEAFAPPDELSPASPSARLLALLLDGGLVLLPTTGCALILRFVLEPVVAPTELTGLDRLMHGLHAMEAIWIPAALVGALTALVYSAVFAVAWRGQSPGRRRAGIRLATRSGLPPGAVRGTVRAVFALLSTALFLSGWWWCLFDAERRALHDRLMGTRMVRTSTG